MVACGSAVAGVGFRGRLVRGRTQVDVVLYFAPVASMFATLLAATRVLPAREIPGMSRIGGMFLFGGVLFFGAFILSRSTFVACLQLGEHAFFASGAAALLAMALAWWMMFGCSDDEGHERIARRVRYS